MAGAQRSTEHDESDRRAFAIMLVAVGLVGSLLMLAHRQTMTHGSRPGDACPTSARGGIVGLDAETGEVRWTNIVPDGGGLRLDDETGEVHHVRAAIDGDDPNASIIVDRVIAADTGRVVSCTSERVDGQVVEQNEWISGDDPVDPPLTIDDVTIMRWGSGLRATDPDDTGVWGLESVRAHYLVGDDLLIDQFGGPSEPSRTARIDARTGEQQWSVEGILTNRGPQIGTVVTNSWKSMDQLVAFDPETGEQRWTTKVPGFDPELSDGVRDSFDIGRLVIVPIGDDGRIAAIDAQSGEVRWTARAGTPGKNHRYSIPGRVHAAVLSTDGETVVVAVDAWMPEKYD